MAQINLPLSIIYQTKGITPVADVVEALQAADALAKDAVSLLPSLIDGLQIEQCSLNVRSLTQESPLREYFLLALIVAFQDDLKQEVPPLLEGLFTLKIDDRYDTLVTVVFMIVVFYGAGMAIDMVKKTFSDSLPRAKYDELVDFLASELGKPASEIRDIVDARFKSPAAAKRLVREAKRIFLPSQKEMNVPMLFDRDLVPTETLREIPYSGESDKKADFNRYEPYENVDLELHAQDRDKSATGWAAVAPSISESRLKVRVMDPVQPSDLWGNDTITADIVVVLKMTAYGYKASEIQITNLITATESQSDQLPPMTE